MTEQKEPTLSQIMEKLTSMEAEISAEISGLKTEFSGLKTEFSGFSNRMDRLERQVDSLNDDLTLRKAGSGQSGSFLARSDLLPRDTEERGQYAGFGGPRDDYLSYFDHG